MNALDNNNKDLTSIIVIPARMQSSRLPNKPMKDICGLPMILRVVEQARKSKIGDVIVACSEQEVFDCVSDFGATAVMTDASLPSGSDRVWQAIERLKLENSVDIIVNLQGDLPLIAPESIIDVQQALIQDHTCTYDIATLACSSNDIKEINDPNVVKVVTPLPANAPYGSTAKALYFSRQPVPYVRNNNGTSHIYHHVGIYAYRTKSLKKFVNLHEGILEQSEKLEQLRALENNMNICCSIVTDMPIGVDTQSDLEQAIKIFQEL